MSKTIQDSDEIVRLRKQWVLLFNERRRLLREHGITATTRYLGGEIVAIIRRVEALRQARS